MRSPICADNRLMVPIIVWFLKVFTQDDLSRRARQQAAYIDIVGEPVECNTKGKTVKSFRRKRLCPNSRTVIPNECSGIRNPEEFVIIHGGGTFKKVPPPCPPLQNASSRPHRLRRRGWGEIGFLIHSQHPLHPLNGQGSSIVRLHHASAGRSPHKGVRGTS